MQKKGSGRKSLKAMCEQAHFTERMAERFETTLSGDEYRHVCNLVKKNRSILVLSISRAQQVHVISYQGRDICVLYNNKRETLVTVFTGRMIVEGHQVSALIKKAQTMRAQSVPSTQGAGMLSAAVMQMA